MATGTPGTHSPAPSGSPAPSTEPTEPTDAPEPTDPPAETPTPTIPPRLTEADLELFWEAYELLRERYVDLPALDPKALTYGAIRGALEALDDIGHTGFLTAEELRAQEEGLEGRLTGIGILLGSEEQGPVVVGVVRNGPAARAGIRRGDRIVAVEGRIVERLERPELAALLRGEAGTRVRLTIERAGVDERFDVDLVREEILLEPLTWAPIPGTDLALLHYDRFSQGAGDAFREALDAILASGATGLVLDLRGNPGGFVGEAVVSASQLLVEGVVYQSQDQHGARTPVVVEPSGVAVDLPLVVIVDEDSASSAEILAGALQDNDRALLVGERTAGTGTVVNTFTLSDGSAIRVGVLRWLTPDGHTIWREGIAPDIPVALPLSTALLEPDDLRTMTPDQLAASEDAQLLRAIDVLAGP